MFSNEDNSETNEKEKKKRQKLVKWNAKKAFKKEEKLFDVEKNIKTRYSHDTILGMHSFNEADDVSKFL